jgi:hypothetical protein
MRHSLHDRVVQGLLALDDANLRRVYAVIEWIAAQPVQAAQAAAIDEDNREVFVHEAGHFRLIYYIARDGRVIFTELLAKPNEKS